jgi:hypothetical protein
MAADCLAGLDPNTSSNNKSSYSARRPFAYPKSRSGKAVAAATITTAPPGILARPEISTPMPMPMPIQTPIPDDKGLQKKGTGVVAHVKMRNSVNVNQQTQKAMKERTQTQKIKDKTRLAVDAGARVEVNLRKIFGRQRSPGQFGSV